MNSSVTTFAVILVLGASAVFAGDTNAPFRAELRKAEDSAAVTLEDGATVVTIASRSGIGGAKLVRTGVGWPAQLTVRLALKGLESLRMENGAIQFDASLKGPRLVPYWKAGTGDQRPQTVGGTLEVVLRKTEVAVEIVVPKELMEGNPTEIRFGWIDFYRG